MTLQDLLKLRESTGEGVLACKAALRAHPDNLESAIEHLRCEGQAVVRRTGSLLPCGCRHTTLPEVK